MEFHKIVNTSVAEHEDWWNILIKGDDKIVVHGWSHLNRYTLKVESGSKTYTLEEFMESDSSIQAKNKLAKYLARHSD